MKKPMKMKKAAPKLKKDPAMKMKKKPAMKLTEKQRTKLPANLVKAIKEKEASGMKMKKETINYDA